MPETENLEASRIIRDKRYQVRQQLDKRVVNRYRGVLLAGNVLPPITVARVGDSLFLVDGWHRLAAMGARETVKAEVVEASERDVFWLAAKANLTHGLPLKSTEVRKVFRAYIRARKHCEGPRLKSYREISRDMGGLKSHMSIRRWMLADFPKVAAMMRKTDQGSAEGGLRSRPNVDGWVDAALSDLKNARARFEGNPRDPDGRRRLMEKAQEIVWDMQQEIGWQPTDF